MKARVSILKRISTIMSLIGRTRQKKSPLKYSGGCEPRGQREAKTGRNSKNHMFLMDKKYSNFVLIDRNIKHNINVKCH